MILRIARPPTPVGLEQSRHPILAELRAGTLDIVIGSASERTGLFPPTRRVATGRRRDFVLRAKLHYNVLRLANDLILFHEEFPCADLFLY